MAPQKTEEELKPYRPYGAEIKETAREEGQQDQVASQPMCPGATRRSR